LAAIFHFVLDPEAIYSEMFQVHKKKKLKTLRVKYPERFKLLYFCKNKRLPRPLRERSVFGVSLRISENRVRGNMQLANLTPHPNF